MDKYLMNKSLFKCTLLWIIINWLDLLNVHFRNNVQSRLICPTGVIQENSRVICGMTFAISQTRVKSSYSKETMSRFYVPDPDWPLCVGPCCSWARALRLRLKGGCTTTEMPSHDQNVVRDTLLSHKSTPEPKRKSATAEAKPIGRRGYSNGRLTPRQVLVQLI